MKDKLVRYTTAFGYFVICFVIIGSMIWLYYKPYVFVSQSDHQSILVITVAMVTLVSLAPAAVLCAFALMCFCIGVETISSKN